MMKLHAFRFAHALRRVLLPAALALGAATAAAEWRRVDSDHFTLYTEREATVANDLLRQLEHMHWLGEMYLGASHPAPGTRNRFAIYELRGRLALQELFTKLGDRVAGTYVLCSEGAVAYSVQGDRSAGLTSWGQSVLQHEYAHHLMFSRIAASYPPWFVEGFAEFLSQTAERSDTLVAGAHNRWRSERTAATLDAADLLGWHRLSAARRESDIHAFYSKAWRLTHYLLTDTARAGRLRKYFERLARGDDPVAGFEAEFGLTMAELERELRTHARRLPVLSIPLSALPVPQIRAVPLPADAERYLLEESRLRTCAHRDKTLGPVMLERLRRAAAAPDASAGARRAAARAELLLGDAQAARGLLEPLIEHQADDADDGDALYLLGRTWARLSETLSGDEQREARAKARASLVRAYRLRKDDAPTLYHLALALQHEGVDRNVFNAARAARHLAPAVPDYALLAMRLELLAGDREAAERALLPLNVNPHATDLSERVRRAIEALRAGGSADEVAALMNPPPAEHKSEPAKPPEKEPETSARP